MSKKKILITWPLPAAVMARARETYDVIAHGDESGFEESHRADGPGARYAWLPNRLRREIPYCGLTIVTAT